MLKLYSGFVYSILLYITLAIMMKKVSNYFAIPLAICSVIFMALKPSPSLDVAMYSTEGLELDFTVQQDLASTL